MKFFCLENSTSCRHGMLANAISLQVFSPDATLVIYSNEDVHDYISNFYDFTLNIEYRSLKLEPSPFNFIPNMISILHDFQESGDDAIFISNNVIIINDLRELYSKQDDTSDIVVLKRDADMKNDKTLYPLALVLFRTISNNVTEFLTNYYEKNKEIIDGNREKYLECNYEDSMSEDEVTVVNNTKATLMAPVNEIIHSIGLEMVKNSETISKSFFNENSYMDISNFFAFDKKWELKQLKLDQDDHTICRNNNKIYLTCQCPYPDSIPENARFFVMELWSKVEALVVINDVRIGLAQQVTNKLYANKILIRGPKKDLFGKWNRKNEPDLFKTLLALLKCSKNNYFNYAVNITKDYYRTINGILYDYKDDSIITPDIISSHSSIVFLLNYNNQVLETLKDNYVYCGIFNPYVGLLDEMKMIDINERNDKTFHFTDDGVYSGVVEYETYIEDLKHYTKSFITDSTPKAHIVDCLALGIVLEIDENCNLLEIDELYNEEMTRLEKIDVGREYYKNTLSVDGLAHRIIKCHMEFKQRDIKLVDKSSITN